MKRFEHFHDANVLITGGLGFIGSNLAIRLVGIGANVTLVDSMIPEYGGNAFNIEPIRKKVKVNFSDIRDPYSMQYMVKGQDYLFNLAGQTSHMDSMQDPFTDLEINSKAQLSILETCRHYNPAIKIVFASTRQLYGKPEYLPVDERHPVHPVDVNGINKMTGEWYHILYNNIYNIRACALRLTNTYGPRMRIKDARQTFVGIWIRLLLENKSFEVWDGTQMRDFNHVDDCVDALLLSATNEAAYGRIFNLGDTNIINLKDLAELLIKINGSGQYVLRNFPEDRKKIDIGDYYSDYKQIKNLLGWKPHVSLESGLKQTLLYYKEHFDKYI